MIKEKNKFPKITQNIVSEHGLSEDEYSKLTIEA